MAKVKTCRACGIEHKRMGYYCKLCDEQRFKSNMSQPPNCCRNCGALLAARQKVVSGTTFVCGTCGFEPLNGDKFCNNCGGNTKTGQKLCTACNSELIFKSNNIATPFTEDKPDFGIAFLGFLLPIVGLILFLTWNSSQPQKAGSAGKGALLGFIIGLFAWSLIMVNFF